MSIFHCLIFDFWNWEISWIGQNLMMWHRMTNNCLACRRWRGLFVEPLFRNGAFHRPALIYKALLPMRFRLCFYCIWCGSFFFILSLSFFSTINLILHLPIKNGWKSYSAIFSENWVIFLFLKGFLRKPLNLLSFGLFLKRAMPFCIYYKPSFLSLNCSKTLLDYSLSISAFPISFY